MNTYTKGDILLQAKDINLCYGTQKILRDINFTIRDIIRPGLQQGQVVSLIGRSGIGKTQLFRILSGLHRPDSGQVTIATGTAQTGPTVLQQTAASQQVSASKQASPFQQSPALPTGSTAMRAIKPGDMGVVFQNYYQFQWRTVMQSLQLAARQNKALSGKEDEAILNYADRFELTGVLRHYPGQISGGQQQRVSIIQQLLKGSDFLLLDEPFSGLDICVLDKVVDLLIRVSLSGEWKTLIIVSHDIATTVAISDTVFILGREEGQEGSTICKEVDLIERGLAWEKDVRDKKEFAETIREIKACL